MIFIVTHISNTFLDCGQGSLYYVHTDAPNRLE